MKCNINYTVIVYVFIDYIIGVPHSAFCAPKHAESSSWGTPHLQTIGQDFGHSRPVQKKIQNRDSLGDAAGRN